MSKFSLLFHKNSISSESKFNFIIIIFIFLALKSKYNSLINSEIYDKIFEKIYVKKSVIFSSSIYNLKFSKYYPNILSCCNEEGYISIIDTNSDYINSTNNNNFLNANPSNEILPIFNENIHSNAIFGLDYTNNDTSLLSAGADFIGKITNLSSDKLGQIELELIGHTKRIKCITQDYFHDNIIATCGGEGIIFLWDKRDNNKRYCNKKFCKNYGTDINHIHPIGAFRNFYKDLRIKKKYFNDGNNNNNLFNLDIANTFTNVDFFNKYLLVSTETNSDSIKFWDIRNMLTNELDYFFNEKKITINQINKKLMNKDYLASIDQYTNLYVRYANLKEKNSLSSKFNSNNNLLFNNNNKINNNNNKSLVVYKNKDNIKEEDKNEKIDKYWKIFQNENKKSKKIEKDLNNNSEQLNIYYCSVFDLNINEEIYLKNKIKEIKSKPSPKALTSIHINRIQRKILVNTISGSQFIYDPLYMNINPPIELKGHSSSLYVKSVLSPNGRFVLSGSKEPSIYLWDTLSENKEPLKLTGYHRKDVCVVDWGRNYNNFIASGCDGGIVLLWDVKQI